MPRSYPALDIARALMGRPEGCTTNQLVLACGDVGLEISYATAYASMAYQRQKGRAVYRWRNSEKEGHVGQALAVFFSREAAADASGLFATEADLAASNGGTYHQRRNELRRAERRGQAATRPARPAKPPKPPKKPRTGASLVTKVARADDAPVRVANEKRSIAKVTNIDYSRARITSTPAPRGRYEIDPDTRVLGGFATAGIGRYLDTEAA